MENHPEVHGDCLFEREPSGRHTIRFGEKGLIWAAFTIRIRAVMVPTPSEPECNEDRFEAD